MKVVTSLKLRCPKCKIVKRGNRLRRICDNPRHKGVQGRGRQKKKKY